jgi:hypothetical protein
MEREEALRLLPSAHATALRLKEAGAADRLIASALAVELEAVAPLLQVAEAKLAELVAPESSVDTDPAS